MSYGVARTSASRGGRWAQPAATGGGDMKHILLVDDDAANCAAASALLQDLECAVETVTDGGAALERLRQAVPDAVLVGLNIPDMAGGAFVEACHLEPYCRDVPVVVMAVTP